MLSLSKERLGFAIIGVLSYMGLFFHLICVEFSSPWVGFTWTDPRVSNVESS